MDYKIVSAKKISENPIILEVTYHPLKEDFWGRKSLSPPTTKHVTKWNHWWQFMDTSESCGGMSYSFDNLSKHLGIGETFEVK